MREVDRLAVRADWDALIVLRDACLEATEETGRQLWGPARYAAYRIALEGPAALAAAMVEPGVLRFGLGPLTEVVAQHHRFADLAPHLDAASLPVVAQERVLRGEDLRDDARARGADDDPPLVLQPFEPAFVLPEYRADERLDGAVLDPSEAVRADRAHAGWGALPLAPVAARSAVGTALVRALEDAVAPWSTQSSGTVRVASCAGTTDDALRAVSDDPHGVLRGPITTPELFALVAHAAASGGVHGRRRGGAAGRSQAWWVARCATGLERDTTVDPDALEYLLEDVTRIAARSPQAAAWRLELALGAASGEWAVAVAAFDREDDTSGAPPSGGTAPW